MNLLSQCGSFSLAVCIKSKLYRRWGSGVLCKVVEMLCTLLFDKLLDTFCQKEYDLCRVWRPLCIGCLQYLEGSLKASYLKF